VVEFVPDIQKWVIKVKLKGLGVPLVHRRDGRTLVGLDLLVVDNANDELVAEGSRLAQSVAVAVVHHVEAAVHVHAYRAAATAPRTPPRSASTGGRDGMATGPEKWSASTEAPSTMPPTTHAASVRTLQPPLPASMETQKVDERTEWESVVLCK
jgi:hypothetical protein